MSSSSKSRTTPAEWFLARLTDEDRAAAILGDLEELAQTRGRLWIWIEYIRTLISLGWRAPVAFVVAMVSMRFPFRTIILLLLMNHSIGHLSDPGLSGILSTHARILLYNCLINAARFLIFALPFAVVRFGLRNPLTQLTCALLLIALPVYSLRPWLMDVSGVLMVLAVAAAVLISVWRRPMIVLAATAVTAMAAMVSCVFITVSVFHQKLITVSQSKWPTYEAIAFAIAAIVCLYLHRLLLRQRPAIA